ncbi:MAG: hypothetical protein RBR44_02230, partial [Bacilli bacterium]|nr:hypothetical protein [Bacilli bacterium]
IFRYIYITEELGPGCLSANMVLYYFPISLLAFLFRTFKSYFMKLPRINIIKAVVGVMCLAIYVPILVFYKNWLPGLSLSFGIILWHWCGSVCGTIAYFYLFSIIGRYSLIRKISALGSFSGPFYLVHVYIIRLFASYISRPAVFDGPAISFVTFLTIIFTVGSFAITALLCFIPYTDFFLFLNYKRIRNMLFPREWISVHFFKENIHKIENPKNQT